MKKIFLNFSVILFFATMLAVALPANAADTCPVGTTQSSSPLETVIINSDSSVPTPSSNVLSSGQAYLLVSSGTWLNIPHNLADAEYTSINNWTTWMDGYDIDPYFLGEGEFDLQIDNAFVNWGAYNPAHSYSYLYTGTGSQANFLVFDGNSTVPNPAPNPAWYGDNSGNLTVNIYSCEATPPPSSITVVATKVVCNNSTTSELGDRWS